VAQRSRHQPVVAGIDCGGQRLFRGIDCGGSFRAKKKVRLSSL